MLFPAAGFCSGIVCFGDSITGGYKGVAAYPFYLNDLVGNVVNKGVGGEMTSGGVTRISKPLADFQPDTIIIMEGANDAFWGVSASTVKHNLGVMINKSIAAGAVPILSTITPDTYNASVTSSIPNSYNPQIKALASEKGVTLVDSYAAVAANWANLTQEGLHTNAAGSLVLAENFAAYVPSSGGGGGGGCFIATAAFGTYLEPQVEILKDFRDNYLLTNAPGRVFVENYYRYSPPVAHFIAQHEWLRAVVRGALYPLIGVSYALLYGGIIAQIMLTGIFAFFTALSGLLIKNKLEKRSVI